ncbi:MAG: dihydrolipoyl dehydrogenase [Planctomycetota bacterium]
MADTTDIAVIGGGPGGYTAAIRAAQRGARVALFERDRVGGVCLNRGCIPSKALIETARAFHTAKAGNVFGVQVEPAPTLDWAVAQSRKTAVVERLRKGVEFLLKKNKISLYRGQARLEGGNRIVCPGEEGEIAVEAEGIVLAMGSEPIVIPGLEPDGDRVLDSDGVLSLTAVPSSMVVIGGGAIGAEWASLFASLGTQIDVVEIMDQLVPGADPEIAKELLRGFKKRGIRVHLRTKVESLDRGTESVGVQISSGKTLNAEKVLVSVGRRPGAGDTLSPESGVEVEEGRVPVDEKTRTNGAGIHAIGDVTGEVLLAHYASHQGLVAAEVLTGGDRKVDRFAVPMCVFSEPEVAWVGYTPAQADSAGVDIRVGSFPFRALGRAHTAEEVWGFVKLLGEKESGKIVGFHAVGPRATDLVAQGTLAVRYGLTAHQVEEAIHAHPTFPEAVNEAAADLLGQAIHK